MARCSTSCLRRTRLKMRITGQLLLKCFIDRKDNIVDLSELWHKYNPKQEFCDEIIARYKDDILYDVHSQLDIDRFLRDNWHLKGKVYFSFVKYLLPKGGE